MKKILVSSIFILLNFCTNCQNYFNLNFETFENKVPYLWQIYADSIYDLSSDNEVTYHGHSSLCISRKTISENKAIRDNGVNLVQNIPNELLKDKKKLKIIAYIKNQNNINSNAVIWCKQFDKNNKIVSQQTSSTDKNNLSLGWEKKVIEIEVSRNSIETKFGCIFIGSGKSWFDAFEIFIDEKKLVQASYSDILPSKNELNWLNKNISEINSQENESTNSDLIKLVGKIKDAKIVAIGEPTHGTSEAIQLKLRMLKYLVEHKGFNTFVLESEMCHSEVWNNYILGKEKYSRIILTNKLPIWKSQEMLDIFEWMKDYNQNHENKLTFWGIDMQSSAGPLQNITSFGNKYDTEIFERSSDIRKKLSEIWKEPNEIEAEKLRDTMRSMCKYLSNYFSDNESNYVKKTDPDTVRWIKQNIELIQQSLLKFKNNNSRDSCMGINLRWFLDTYPKTKMLLSAHNFHVAKDKEYMGKALFDFYKNDYFSIGITTSEGKYSAIEGDILSDPKECPLKKPFPGCFEYHLQKAKFSSFFIEIPLPKNSINNKWLNRTYLFRNIGYAKMENQFRYEIPSIAYNIIIFFKKTHSTNPITK